MKIYVASSWRNSVQPEVVRALRSDGHDVYDFRNPAPGNTGFSWRGCASPAELFDPRLFCDRVLMHPAAQSGFKVDMEELVAAEATVLVLPCGRSAHLELGYAVGIGQRTYVLLDNPLSEPELMYLACTRLMVTLAELRDELRGDVG